MAQHKMRKWARGKPCQARVYGVCNNDPETTVLCHIRRGHGSIGTKPPDLLSFIGCYNCHQFLGDGQDDQLAADVLDAHLRTLRMWIEHETRP